MADQKVQQPHDIIESTAIVHRGQKVEPLERVAQPVEARDLRTEKRGARVASLLYRPFYLIVQFPNLRIVVAE